MRRLSARSLGTVSLAAIAMAVALPAPALAQEQETGEVGAEPAPGDEQAAEDRQQAQPEEESIVVTGSRLRRSEFNSPDPVTIIDPRLGLRQGQIETAEIIQSAPIAAGSTQITSAISSNFVTNGGEGSQTISLRGLGQERTLTLINGRRAGPAGVRGGVSSFDLNVLPASIMQNVEILKTGASSVYGSDAVAGVVNILTRRDFDGLEMRAYALAPEHGGGESYALTATFGQRFDRGHILVAADYNRRNELRRGQREFLRCTEDYLFNDSGQRIDVLDPRTGQPTCNNTQGNFIALIDFIPDILGTTNVEVDGTPIQIIQYNAPGARLDEFLSPLAPPTNQFEFGSPNGYYPVFYDRLSTGLTNQLSPYEPYTSIIPRTERLTLYADAAFDLTPSITLFTELLFNRRTTRTNAQRQLFPLQYTSDTILPGALFGDPGTGDPINQGFTGDVILQPVVATDGGADSGTRVNYYRGVFGARGDIFRDWRWEAYIQYSRSDADYFSDVVFADSMDPQTLRTESCVGTVTAVRGVPCIDINFTDPRVLAGNFTQQERDFLFGEEEGNTLYTQWTSELSLNGDLFQLPAGPVRLAAGIQVRRDAIEDVPGEVTRSGNAYNSSTAGITAGNSWTKEAFAEIEVPLIHDTPLIQSFTLSAAARLTNVTATRASDGFQDSDNGNFTYKVGLNWEVTDWLRFRGTYGTSYRAPALFEQFLANESSFPQQSEIDPCIRWGQRLNQGLITQRLADNCASDGVPDNYIGGPESATSFSTGGIGRLDPETSRAWTASVVLTPRGWLWGGARASIAVDYFDIDVRGEIARLGGNNILTGCYNSEFFPDDPLCDLFTRDDPDAPNGPQVLEISNPYLNINRQRNRGVDVTARFLQNLGRWGSLSLVAQMTWQIEDRFELFAGTITDDNGEAGDPAWIGDFNLIWTSSPVTITYGLDVVGGTSNLDDLIEDRGSACFNNNFYGGTVCPDVRLGAKFYHALSFTYAINDRFDFTLGVANLFDNKPPRVSTAFSGIQVFGQTPVLGSQYDYLGRRFFATVGARF